MQKKGKERLFEVLSRLDKTFKPKLNEVHQYVDTNESYDGDPFDKPQNQSSSNELNSGPRSLSQIAREIRRDWSNVNFGAKPYLDAMSSLDSVDDNYGYDSGKSIVLYFLSNAGTWKGDTAKRIKAELKKMVGLKEEFAPDQNGMEVTNTVSPATSTAPLNEDETETSIHKWVYFAFNYPDKFIEQVWADNNNLMNHLKSKFQGYYNQVGSSAVMNKFYVELDMENQRLLEDWVMENYKG